MPYTPELLSGSVDGKPIKISGTATGTANTIHQADAAKKDEVYLLASNLHNADVKLTVEWGGATDPDDLLVKNFVIPPEGPPTPIAVGPRRRTAKW
jgi:hypothetical protein